MSPRVTALLAAIRSSFRTRAELEAEILALRHQLAVLQQAAPRRLRLSRADRLFWVLLSRVWSERLAGCRADRENPPPSSSGIAACSPGIGAGARCSPVAVDLRSQS